VGTDVVYFFCHRQQQQVRDKILLDKLQLVLEFQSLFQPFSSICSAEVELSMCLGMDAQFLNNNVKLKDKFCFGQISNK
jgi:hypothetical protein